MLVIVEKPFVARMLHPQLKVRFPNEPLTYLLANQFGWPFVFDYPSNLSWHQYPLWLDARYRLVQGSQRQMEEEEEAGGLVQAIADYEALQAQPLLVAVDPRRSALLAAQRLVKHLQQLGKVSRLVGYHGLTSLVASDIDRSLSSPLDESEVAAECEAAQLKADFEFSFLLNAAGLLTRAYHAAGGQASQPVFSKYGVQALYALRQRGATPEGRFIHAMANWRGTGRYAGVHSSLGSAASRDALVEQLQQLGLVSGTRPDATGLPASDALSVTALGDAFLSRLHPDCEDADLPFRIEQWLVLPGTGRPAAQRYIRTWFGKQKRFMPR